MKGTETLALLTALLLVGCSQPSPPSDEELVTVVRNGLVGRTYEETVTKTKKEWETTRRHVACSQYDWDTDPYKGDRDRGTCRGEGGAYGYGYKTVSKTVSKDVPYTQKVTRKCPVPPPVNSSAWSITRLGETRWKVSVANSIWIVTQTDDGRLIAVSQGKC